VADLVRRSPTGHRSVALSYARLLNRGAAGGATLARARFDLIRRLLLQTGRLISRTLASGPLPAPRACVAALVISAGAVAGAAYAGSTNSGSGKHACSSEFGSFSVGHWPAACWRPYGPRSPFNVPIPAHPRLAPDSAAIVGYVRSQHWFFQENRVGNFTADSGGSRPVYWSRSSDPLVKVTCHGSASCPRSHWLHIPAGAQPENQSDGHMTVVDQAHGIEDDFWLASSPEHGKMTAWAESRIAIGAKAGTGLGGKAEGADLGLLGGLIRARELAAGRIEHALAITVQCIQLRDVWPSPTSRRGDVVCPNNGAGPHFASLLQLNMSDGEIAATHAPAWQRTIMEAMARYGMYVVDTNGPSLSNREMSLLNEDDQSFTSFGYPAEMRRFVEAAGGGYQLAGVPIDVSKLRVIASCVARRTC
jgi:hypothetical protein